MSTVGEQIAAIEKEIRETPYHKGTEHHIGKLRAKLARLKDKEFEVSAKKGGGTSQSVRKQGDATVVLVGQPSVGKSTLLNCLTNAKSKVAPYAFTTLTVIPGMMEYQDARVQILDVPGLIKGAQEGKGKGRQVLSVIRAADLIVLMTDVHKHKFTEIEKALYKNGIRMNQEPPRVEIERKLSGGIIVHTNIRQVTSQETIKEVVSEMGFKNAEITIAEEVSVTRLIDALSPSRVYIPALFVVNKIDQKKNVKQKSGYIYISSERQTGIENLKKAIWDKLEFIRVYLVKETKEPHFSNPLVMRRDQTLKEVAAKIGTDFAIDKQKAKIWGAGAKYPGQEVSLTIKVVEGMQIRFI